MKKSIIAGSENAHRKQATNRDLWKLKYAYTYDYDYRLL